VDLASAHAGHRDHRLPSCDFDALFPRRGLRIDCAGWCESLNILTVAAQDAAGGTPSGRYRLIELLGRGGMGEVWRAHDTETDRIVAIKLLPAHFSDNEEFQRQFRREAHAAARLNTPHVIPIHN
jgi:serine/threonine protein kinase